MHQQLNHKNGKWFCSIGLSFAERKKTTTTKKISRKFLVSQILQQWGTIDGWQNWWRISIDFTYTVTNNGKHMLGDFSSRGLIKDMPTENKKGNLSLLTDILIRLLMATVKEYGFNTLKSFYFFGFCGKSY